MSLLQDEYRDWCRCETDSGLSNRDMEIAVLFAKGCTTATIGKRFGITDSAVGNILVRNVYPHYGIRAKERPQRRMELARKLGVNSG
jgi:DNA-binding NarL/FixJ family response regulator